VFCDIDGVLADFVPAACQFFGIKSPKVSPEDQVIFNTIWESADGWPKLKKEWPTFWADLDPMPHALELWSEIRPFHPALLSAIPRGWETSQVGKQLWAEKHLPGFAEDHLRIITGPRSIKKHYAMADDDIPNVLIDDFDKNIEEWTAAGGIGILYTDGSVDAKNVGELLRG